MNKNKKEERLGQEKISKQGYPMRVVEYIDANNMVVEFDDGYNTRIKCIWSQFKKGNIVNPRTYQDRLGEERYNNQGDLMRVIIYNNCLDIIVEFQDKYKATVHTNYDNFIRGQVKNPYHPQICGVGIVGNKYDVSINGIAIKEYNIWHHMIRRCFNKKVKERSPTYKDATCCEEWLLYENFYEWLHLQKNFDKWLNNDNWNLDKDILIRGNKTYSPETCCLVPHNINSLFTKHDSARGNFPIGVYLNRDNGLFVAQCNNPFTNKRVRIGYYQTEEEAFQAYKKYKEDIIKQIAQIEFDKGNITEQCYEAMMNYKVEITD